VFKQDGKRLIYRFDDETVWIEPWGADALRVRATRCPDMPSKDWALLPPTGGRGEVEVSDDGARISNGRITAELTPSGMVTFKDSQGRVLLQEYVRSREQYNFAAGERPSGFASALNIEAREFKPILGADYRLTMRFESDPNERIYGMGQYQQPYLDLKGCELELAQRNSQASVPFMVSNLGYGLLWNNPAVGRVCFGKNMTIWEAQSTQILDYWITAGETPRQILERYGQATGTAPQMPEYGLGFWQCKLRYQTQEELLQVAREYKRRNLPIDVIVIDFFHWPMQGEWKFDPEYWPDPAAMVQELKEMGIELMVSIWPTVDHRSENFEAMREQGYLVRTERGHRIAMDFHGNTIHLDVTNPDARRYLWSKIKNNYYKYGIKMYWLDVAEPEYTYYDFDLYRYHLGPHVKIGNVFPLKYAQAFYEGMTAECQKNPLNLVRCAWAGSQRYGALIWSGDIHSSFRSLRNQVAAGLNMGMAGIPWWTTDIGGFHGGDPEDPAFRELFIRWFQYGTFCPVMRLHGDREPHAEPLGTEGGGVCSSGADNEVWSYGDRAYAICVQYMNMRERLRPYLRQLMTEAHERGVPPMRPLFFDFPQDDAAWEAEDQYMFGPDLVVAPILESGAETRQVYLPYLAGQEEDGSCGWKDIWTGEMVSGGKTVMAKAPLEQIPLFARAGTPVESMLMSGL